MRLNILLTLLGLVIGATAHQALTINKIEAITQASVKLSVEAYYQGCVVSVAKVLQIEPQTQAAFTLDQKCYIETMNAIEEGRL